MDDIRRALVEAHRDDLGAIRLYILWVRLRRRVHDFFYYPAHWVRPSHRPMQVHWVR